MKKQNRRDFIKKSSLGGLGLASASSIGMSAESCTNIIGANDRLHVAIAGLGRRLGAFYAPIAHQKSNSFFFSTTLIRYIILFYPPNTVNPHRFDN